MINKKTILKDEKYLRQISKTIGKDDIDLEKNIFTLTKFCKENDVLAMAAVQLGIPKRIIYLKNTNLEKVMKFQFGEEDDKNYDEAQVLINPIITKREGLTLYWESCASCLDNCGLVKRPYSIEIEYYNKNFQKEFKKYEGFPATVISHEYDHLDGILHIDKAETIIIMSKEERKKLRQKEEYKIISKIGNYEDLLKKEKIKRK